MTGPDRARLLVADAERIPEAVVGTQAEPAVQELLRGREPRRIVLTGLGSSRFAAVSVAAGVADAWRPVLVEHASTDAPAPVGPGDLVVTTSSSGATAETVAAARRARQAGATVVAVTNSVRSPLAAAADATVALGCEPEQSGIATTTHAASIVALAAILDAAGAPIDLPAVRDAGAAAARAVLASRDAWLAPAADTLDRAEAVHLIAPASALGAAEQGALLLREAPRLPADVTEAGEWLHVGLYTAWPGYRALLFTGTAHDEGLLATFADRGVVAIGVGPATSAAVDRLAARVPFPDPPVGPPPAPSTVRLSHALAVAAATSLLAAELWSRTTAAG